MKKLFCMALIGVFAVSFSVGFMAADSSSAVPFCKAKCDYKVGYIEVCCPIPYGQGNRIVWECYYDYTKPCGHEFD